MKRFRFRLERLERWRRQSAEERKREHDLSLQAAASAERLLAEHEALVEAFLEDERRRRKSEGITIETWIAGDSRRLAFDERRDDLLARRSAARAEVETTLTALIEARRELKVIEALGRARLLAWRRAADVEIQKMADEAHRARLVPTGAAESAPVDMGGAASNPQQKDRESKSAHVRDDRTPAFDHPAAERREQ